MPRGKHITSAATQHDSILVQRLRQMIAARNTTAQTVSRAAGFNSGMVRDVLVGKVKVPTQMRLERIAEILRTDVAYLLGQHDDAGIKGGNDPAQGSITPPPRRHGVRPIRVVGIAVSGFFQTDPIDWQSTTMIDGITNRMLPDARHFALLLRDGSSREMNDNNGYALCTDPPDAAVLDGKTYATLRTNSEGQTEVTVRRAKVLHDHVELRDYINGKDVLRLGRDLKNTDVSKPVQILGLAYAIILPLI